MFSTLLSIISKIIESQFYLVKWCTLTAWTIITWIIKICYHLPLHDVQNCKDFNLNTLQNDLPQYSHLAWNTYLCLMRFLTFRAWMLTLLHYLIDLIVTLYILYVCYVMFLSWYCQTPVLGLGLGVDFTFAGDNHKNDNNPHLNFVKGTVLGDKEQGVGIRDKG